MKRYTTNQGCEEKFEEAMLSLVSKVNANEPGNILYELCRMMMTESI